jgi:hypothetical protein
MDVVSHAKLHLGIASCSVDVTIGSQKERVLVASTDARNLGTRERGNFEWNTSNLALFWVKPTLTELILSTRNNIQTISQEQ